MQTVLSKPEETPHLGDLISASQINRIKEEHEALKEGVAEWVQLIHNLIEQVEGSNYTDRHGHALEMNAHYKALKDSVTE